jgi:ribosomal protein S18 acetylase RimI-like enzyme
MPAHSPVVEIVQADGLVQMNQTRAIFQEYAATLPVSLCFQGFEQELLDLPGEYAQPRGALLLAWTGGVLVGCCALRPLDASDYANAAEMKRLFVRPAYRGQGLGRLLTEAILDAARAAGFSCVLLDTLDDMESARALYEDLGFVEIPPYYHNPIAGAHYLKVDLD